MGSGWENPGPARRVIIAGPNQQLLVYRGAPGPGTLIGAFSSEGGTDPYGNSLGPGGLTISEYTGHTAEGISFLMDDVAHADIIWAGGIPELRIETLDGGITLDASAQAGLDITISAADAILLQATRTLLLGTLQVGSGPPGEYYARHATYSQGSVLSGTTKFLTTNGTAVKLLSDYGSCFSAGVFTAPVDSFYDASHHVNGIAASTRTAAEIRKNGNVIAQNETPNTADVITSVNAVWLNATETLDFGVFQNSGATVTATGDIMVARRL